MWAHVGWSSKVWLRLAPWLSRLLLFLNCLLILQARADLASGVHKRAAKMNGQLQLRSWRDLPSWAHGPMPLMRGPHSHKSGVAAGGALRCMAWISGMSRGAALVVVTI